MTPIGHTAAGYLISTAAIKVFNPPLPHAEISHLVLWGIFFGVIVDWDLIVSFAMEKSLKMGKVSHRRFPSHAPIVLFCVSVITYLLYNSTYGHYFTLIMFLGLMSHVTLDSIEYGIMWTWPVSKKLYSLRQGPVIDFPRDGSLIMFYWNMTKAYAKTKTFYAETFIVMFALVFFVLVSF